MAQTELEQAVVKTIRAEQFVKGAVSNQLYTQENGEEVGNGDSKNEPIDPFRFPDPGFIELKASSFDIREERFNRETLVIPLFGLCGIGKIGHEKPVFIFLLIPDDQYVQETDLSALRKDEISQKGFLALD